jgi:signal transduction histidine kinase
LSIAPNRLKDLVRSLRTDRNQLLAMMEHTPTMVAILRGPDHVVETANKRFRELCPGRDLAGLPFREAFPTLADGPHHAALDAVFGGGEPLEARNAPWWVAERPDGRFASFDYVYVPLQLTSGEVEGVGVMAMDASTARPARPPAPLERDVLAGAPVPGQPAPRPADELLSSLAFDLRTATHVVMGYASILKQDGGEVQAKLLGATRVLGQLVNDVLDLEQLRSGTRGLDRRLLSFTALMDAALAELAGAASAKGHSVVAELPDGLPPLLADEPRLLRALTHALERTIEVTPPGGEIRVAVRQEPAELVCEIRGGGLALPEAQGLRVARALLEAHGGRLEVPVGAGATCRLHIPLAA